MAEAGRWLRAIQQTIRTARQCRQVGGGGREDRGRDGQGIVEEEWDGQEFSPEYVRVGTTVCVGNDSGQGWWAPLAAKQGPSGLRWY